MELKKKSISVHTVVTIVLAVLLALSLALGLTGAWFTDKATGSTTVTFGQVKLGSQRIEITPDSTTALLPTQTIKIANTTYQGVAAYYRLTIGVSSVSKPGVSGSALTTLQQQLEKKLGASTKYGSINASQDATTFAIDDITIDKTTDNTFQNVSCTLTVTLDVIQQEGAKTAAGLSAEAVLDNSATGLANWAKIFEICTEYTNGTAKTA